MKRTLLFSSIIFIYLTGTFSLFTACLQSYHQTAFQQEVLKEEEQEVERLFFSQIQFKALAWKEEGKEFEWNNKMYDVNKIEKIKDGYWIYCENDGFEELLLSILNSVKKEMEGSASTLSTQPQFFQALIDYSFASRSSISIRRDAEYTLAYQSIDLSSPSPPPKDL